MQIRTVMLRVLRGTAISLAILLLVAFMVLQFYQHELRKRNECLLADFHSIHLNQTTWPEAQKLMQRWGKQGLAHGPCNAIDCDYDITVSSWTSLFPNGKAAWLYSYTGRFPLFLQWVGLRFSVLELRFLVEDGTVRRTRLRVTAETQSSGQMSVLLLKATSRDSLEGADGPLNFVGADEELGVHPDFVVGPDSFCTGCETISLDYAVHIDPKQLALLTSFDLSCLTRNLPCEHLPELAPALMKESAARAHEVAKNSVRCTTPAWALARDAKAIWLVDALTTAIVPDPRPLYGTAPSLVEQDRISVAKIFKGPTNIASQTKPFFYPYAGVEYEPRAVPEHLNPGHRYIVFPSVDSDWLKYGADAWRCGVLMDTPQNELAIKQGIALNDHLRVPELSGLQP